MPITLENSLQMQIMRMARTTLVLLYHSEKMQVLSRPEFYAQAGNWSEIFTATPSSTSRLGHGQTWLLPACLPVSVAFVIFFSTSPPTDISATSFGHTLLDLSFQPGSAKQCLQWECAMSLPLIRDLVKQQQNYLGNRPKVENNDFFLPKQNISFI